MTNFVRLHRSVGAAVAVAVAALFVAAANASVAAAAAFIYPQKPAGVADGRKPLIVRGSQVVDFGENSSGNVIVHVRSGRVTISYSESRRNLRPGGDMGSTASFGRDDARGRSDTFGPGRHRTRLRGGIRYALLEGNARIKKLAINPVMIPPAPSVQGFYSSSRLLNQIWSAGVRTLELSTARGREGWVVTDAPKRDRLIWIGDLEMESLSGAYVSRQYNRALDRSLLLFACQQWPSGYVPMTLFVNATCQGQSTDPDGPTKTNDPVGLLGDGVLPAYTAALVSTTKERFMFNGNVGFVQQLLPVLQRTVNYLDTGTGPDGLFRGGVINWRAFDAIQEADTYTNAAWVQALNDLAWLEDYLGLADAAAAHRHRAQQLATAIRTHLYDPGSGLFVGGLSDRLIAQDANVRAVLAGVTSDPIGTLLRLQSAVGSYYGPMTSATDSPYNEQFISPFMSGLQLIALARHNRGAETQTMIERLWGTMMRKEPGTMWEAMSLSGAPKALNRGQLSQGITSLAHGWSTAPTYVLPAYVVGLRPTSPGWKTWEVAPMPLKLRWAEATAWTPLGFITASWHREGKGLRVRVHAPRGTSGVISSRLCGKKVRVTSREASKFIPLC